MEATNKKVKAIVAEYEQARQQLGAEENNEENTENIVAFGPGPVLPPASLGGDNEWWTEKEMEATNAKVKAIVAEYEQAR